VRSTFSLTYTTPRFSSRLAKYAAPGSITHRNRLAAELGIVALLH
jgi:hypothetical protein